MNFVETYVEDEASAESKTVFDSNDVIAKTVAVTDSVRVITKE